MLLRRLYSSLPPRTAAPVATAAPKAPTRGRARPVRLRAALKKTHAPVPAAAVATASSSTSTSTSTASAGRGRRLRRAFGRTEATADVPALSGPGFQPVVLYPFQAGLHLSFTPPHMPLPVHAGVKHYLAPSESRGPLFERPQPPSPLEALEEPAKSTSTSTSASTLDEHLRLTRAFAHPALAHHLATAPATVLDLDADSHLASSLDAARSAHADSAAAQWEATLKRLGATAAPAPAPTAAEQKSLADAMSSLNGLLARLSARDAETPEVAAAEEGVHLDSVKRKRKKKVNRQKYKKRRKATRAQRKRLGK